MPTSSNLSPDKRLRWSRSLAWVAAGLFALGMLAIMPGAWALPDQSPDFQTVPTLTPTPTRPSGGPTATNTAQPDPTNTPQPGATNTPQPGATATPTSPSGATATSTPTVRPGTTPSPTRTRTGPLPAVSGQPGANPCWTVPTPGFAPERITSSLTLRMESDQFLVVPGQVITQRLLVENRGAVALSDVLICNPLDPDLVPGQPTASQGIASMEPEGLIAELGDLAAGQAAQVDLSIRIPVDYPLGGVIESQAWLFSAGQRASTDLLTWALPPAYLPPTGQ